MEINEISIFLAKSMDENRVQRLILDKQVSIVEGFYSLKTLI